MEYTRIEGGGYQRERSVKPKYAVLSMVLAAFCVAVVAMSAGGVLVVKGHGSKSTGIGVLAFGCVATFFTGALVVLFLFPRRSV